VHVRKVYVRNREEENTYFSERRSKERRDGKSKKIKRCSKYDDLTLRMKLAEVDRTQADVE
jgi:hypothetical protein